MGKRLRTYTIAVTLFALVVTSLSWLGALWRERAAGLELTVSGTADASGPWTRSARAASVRHEALDVIELPSTSRLQVTWSGVWRVSHSGPLVVRILGMGDVRVSLDGAVVLVLPHGRAKRWHDASVKPQAGFHDLRVEWSTPRAASRLRLQWAPLGGVFRDLEPESLWLARPSSIRFALDELVVLGRRLVLPSWGVALVLAGVLCARRDLLWDLDARARASGSNQASALPVLARPVPWALAVPFATLGILLPGVLLVLHTAVWRADTDLRYMHSSARYWEELSIASTQYLEERNPSRFPLASVGSHAGHAFKARLLESVKSEVSQWSPRPWEFWEPLSRSLRYKRAPLRHRNIEDVGRSSLTRVGFHIVGGVAPFLLLWVGALCAVPLLAWVAWESLRVGRLVIGLAFGLLFASSPFVIELLTLYYSPAGFYLLGLLLVLALGLFVVLGPPPRLVPLLARCGLGGIAFAVCTICRSGVGLFAPAVVALLLLGVVRGWSTARSRVTVGVLGFCLLFGPYVALRSERHHSVWITVWEGLGDFDRINGYVFSDRAAKARLIEADATDIPRHVGLASAKDDYSRESAFMREEVLEDIRSDPWWFLAILAKRVAVTVTQHKLMDGGRTPGSSFTPAASGNEGAIDVYYRFTRTADWIGLGPWRGELPVPLLWSPLLVWLVWQRRRLLSSSSSVWTVVAVGACSLTVPVAITVAGAFETQSFIVVYYLGAALLCDAAVSLVRPSVAPGASRVVDEPLPSNSDSTTISRVGRVTTDPGRCAGEVPPGRPDWEPGRTGA